MLIRLLLVSDAVRHTVTYAVVASNAGDLEDIVAPEHALVRLYMLVNSSNTYVFVQGVFDVHRIWYGIRCHAPSLSPISLRGPRDLRGSSSTGQDRCVCLSVCACACACVCVCVRVAVWCSGLCSRFPIETLRV